MWMTWLLVVFAMVMIVGPVMMLRPTPGISQVAALRAYANKRGITVRLPRRDPDAADAKGAFYCRPLSKAIRRPGMVNAWGLEKKSYHHDIHFHGHWDWADDGRPDAAVAAQLRQVVEELPQGVSAVEFNVSGAGLLWDEFCRGVSQEAAVDQIYDCLGKILAAAEDSARQASTD